MRHFDFARLERAPLPYEYDRFTFVFEQRLARKVFRLLDRRAVDAHLCREARTQARGVATRYVEADIERPRWIVPRPHLAAARAGDRLDRRRQALALHGVNRHFRL